MDDAQHIADEKHRLSQAHNLQELLKEHKPHEFVTVYESKNNDMTRWGTYCALIPSDAVEEGLKDKSWDLCHESGRPGFVTTYTEKGEWEHSYHRYGGKDGAEPFVIERWFNEPRENYVELSEEFRLFHHLYHDRAADQYFATDEDGEETLVAVVTPSLVRVRMREIQQYLTAKDMHLAIQFDIRENSRTPLDRLGIEEGPQPLNREGSACWGLSYGDLGVMGGSTTTRAFSLMIGKRYIPPLPRSESGLGVFTEPKPREYLDFIIGVNDDGKDIAHTCDPSTLADFFGLNPGAPNFLTPVHFRKSVLDKYFQEPSKYSVQSGSVRRFGSWILRMDDDHDDKVIVWLGDLGQGLSYKEQMHWRQYNLPPSGMISVTAYRRQIRAEFADSDRVEHIFKDRYASLQRVCETHLGWQILLPLDRDDAHHLRTLRVPASDEQKAFDEIVQSLAKILVDSLNEKQLRPLFPENNPQDKGITLLENALTRHDPDQSREHIALLRQIQSLRSTGSAHRKGSNYKEALAKLGTGSRREMLQGLLARAGEFLEHLATEIERGALSGHQAGP